MPRPSTTLVRVRLARHIRMHAPMHTSDMSGHAPSGYGSEVAGCGLQQRKRRSAARPHGGLGDSRVARCPAGGAVQVVARSFGPGRRSSRSSAAGFPARVGGPPSPRRPARREPTRARAPQRHAREAGRRSRCLRRRLRGPSTTMMKAGSMPVRQQVAMGSRAGGRALSHHPRSRLSESLPSPRLIVRRGRRASEVRVHPPARRSCLIGRCSCVGAWWVPALTPWPRAEGEQPALPHRLIARRGRRASQARVHLPARRSCLIGRCSSAWSTRGARRVAPSAARRLRASARAEPARHGR